MVVPVVVFVWVGQIVAGWLTRRQWTIAATCSHVLPRVVASPGRSSIGRATTGAWHPRGGCSPPLHTGANFSGPQWPVHYVKLAETIHFEGAAYWPMLLISRNV